MKKRKKVIVAGSRGFSNYSLLEYTLDNILEKFENPIIISGHAKGADSLGEVYAWKHKLNCKVYKADWNKYGRKAGIIRNQDMARIGDVLVAFWDGNSYGTLDMISLAIEYNLKIYVVDYINKKFYIDEQINDIFGDTIPF